MIVRAQCLGHDIYDMMFFGHTVYVMGIDQ